MTCEEKKYLKRYADIKMWIEQLVDLTMKSEKLLNPAEGISLYENISMFSMKNGIEEVAEVMDLNLQCWLSDEGKYFYSLDYKNIHLMQTSYEPLRVKDAELKPVF